MTPLARPALAALLLAAFAGCGSSPPPEAAAPPPSTVTEVGEATPAPKRPVPPGQLRREDVLAVLSDGPPAFLQRVDVEPVAGSDGRFHGWRVVAVREPEWAGGDIQPGDVVTRVNGKPIENPYQFFEVFQSLAFAPELRVAVERGGQGRELRYPINDDPASPSPPRPQLSASDPPPAADAHADAPKARNKKRR